jgi:putative membrane protein
MDGKRVLLAGIFNFSLAVIAGLFGVTQTLGDVVGFDPFQRMFWVDLFNRAEPLRRMVEAHRFVAILGGTLVLLLVGSATGLVRTLLREYRFRLDRTDTGFRRRRGLLTLTDVTIPAKRIQAAILATGPVKQGFGWWVLKLQSLAQDGGKGDHVVAPLARIDEARTIVDSLGLTIEPSEGEWRRVSSAYVTSHSIILVPVAVVSLGVLPSLGVAGLLPGLAIGALLMAFRYIAWRRTRYALEDRLLFVETGWWRHRREIIPVGKIQSLDLSESFWDRAFRICSIRLGVAGGRLSGHQVPALSRVEAEALRARLVG